MGTHQKITELAAELRSACLTKAERQAAIRQLHELQRKLEIDEEAAVDSGENSAAARLYAEWLQIEGALER